MSVSSRRDWLKQLALGGTAATVALASPGRAAQGGWGATPWRPRYAMCNETFEGWPQRKIFRFLAECGYQGVEIAPFTIHHDVTQISRAERVQLRKWADEAGIEVVGLHWLLAKTQGLHLTSGDPQTRRRTAEYLGELARFCHDLGGQVIVFGSPQQRNLADGMSREQGMQHATEVFREVLPVLERTEITLALEPLGEPTTNFMIDAEDTLDVIRRVDSPWCRLILDCKAMEGETASIPELVRRHREWLVHFHANDPNRRGPGMGDLDFVPIITALQDIRFKGWVSVEVFDLKPGAERLARASITYLRDVVARVAS